LSPYENILWIIVRKKLRVITARTLTRKEFRSTEGNDALCLIVRAHGERFGFCTYMRLLGKRRYKDWRAIPRAEAKKRRLRRINGLKRLKRLRKLRKIRRMRLKRQADLKGISAKQENDETPATVVQNIYTYIYRSI